MAGIELAYSQGVWHKVVETELDKLRSEGTLTSHELNEDALGELQTLPYEEAIMVLKNMYNKPMEEDMSEWIIKECEEMRQKYATPKEKWDYLAAKILVNCSEKAVEAVASKRKTQKLSRGAARKGKPQPSGGAASKGPEGFHYVRTPDGQLKKVFEPTTEENPIVIDD